jgi:hypothetical protein
MLLPQFPFIIISGAVNNAYSYSTVETHYSKNLRDIETRSIVKPLLKRFFKIINTCANPTHKDLCNALRQIYTPHFEDNDNNNNIPLIKQGGLSWQSLIDPASFIILDDVFILHNGMLPCDVMHYASALDLIFVEARDIGFPLIITAEKSPSCISIKPGNSLHHFKAIQASKCTSIAFFKSFFTVVQLEETKVFVIDLLTVKGAYGDKDLLEDVFIVNQSIPGKPTEHCIFYSRNGAITKLTFKYDEVGLLKKIITESINPQEFLIFKNEMIKLC